MTVWTIRPGFAINLLGTIYQGGQDVDLSELQFQLHKHKLEGVSRDVIPINTGGQGFAQSAASAAGGAFAPRGGGGNSDCCYPAPHVSSILPNKISVGETTSVIVEGSFFTPDTTVSASFFTVTKTDFINSHKLVVWIEATAVEESDLVVDNSTQSIIPKAIISQINTWYDFRAGGMTIQSADFTMDADLTIMRSDEGIYFAGDTGWDTWASFDKLLHPDTEPKTYEFIIPRLLGPTMLGIGYEQNIEVTNQAFYELEVGAFFNSSASFWGLYGDRTSQSVNEVIPAAVPLKIVFEGNGNNGNNFYIYQLPSLKPTDWNDTSKELVSGKVTANFKHDGAKVCPFFVPHTSGQTYTAVRVG